MGDMTSEYRRGWEDAIDVVLELKDWKKIEKIKNRLKRRRIDLLLMGPPSGGY